jgi:dipeptidyl aminopeptidase/acylaminoacyl peptidase
MNADGTNQTRLTNDPARDGVPDWSPDGAKIAFLSGGGATLGICIMKSDGTNQQRLVSGGGYPLWSPDGTKLIFATRSGISGIYVMNSDGTNQQQLTTGGDLFAVWSPRSTSLQLLRDELPATFRLKQNYPNPFNPETTIKFQIPDAGVVTLKVYNALGREVATLVNEELKPGSHEATFDGSGLAGGVYYYRLQIGEFGETKTMAVVK